MLKRFLNRMPFSLRAISLFGLVALLAGCDMEMSANKGSINITSVPDGAEIMLNGKLQGTTPKNIQGLAAGDYIIELQKEGYNGAIRSISLLDGQQTEIQGVVLEQQTGLLLVESSPLGAEVVIEGISKGLTPLLLTDLPFGSYSLTFQATGRLPRTLDVALKDRTPIGIFAELSANTAQLTVTSEPSGAEIRINGLLAGTAPTTVEEVQAGESEVRVSLRGYKPYSRKMTFEATKPYEIYAKLEALPSGLTILTQPAGARIFVDNKLVGDSPVTMDLLKEGPHEITATLEGYATKTKSIFLEPNINDSVDFAMVKNSGTLVIDTEPAGVKIYLDGALLTTTKPRGGSDTLSKAEQITLKSDTDHSIQLVRDGFVSKTKVVRTEVDQVVTLHEVLKRIFVYDTQIITRNEIIKCRLEYKLPNGNIYYERFPGVYDTAKASDIVKVKAISITDESNREARRLLELNRKPDEK